MRKINFILLIAASITFLICIVFYLFLPSIILRCLITGSLTWIVYWVGWLLGYSCGSSEEKAKNKPRLYLPLEKEDEDHSLDALEYAKMCESNMQARHDEIAQIVEAQRLYAQSKDKKVCKKCVNCKHLYKSEMGKWVACVKIPQKPFINKTKIYQINNCEHFKEKENENK